MAKKTTAESIARRWTPRLVESGFIPVSTYFIDNYHRLQPKMTPAEAMFIIHLVKHKWDERNPHPSFASLAKRMGLSSTAVRNHARALEKKHYVRRIPVHGQANEFDLRPLFDALERLHMADQEKKPKGRRSFDDQAAEGPEGTSKRAIDPLKFGEPATQGDPASGDTLPFAAGQVLQAEDLNAMIHRIVALERELADRLTAGDGDRERYAIEERVVQESRRERERAMEEAGLRWVSYDQIAHEDEESKPQEVQVEREVDE